MKPRGEKEGTAKGEKRAVEFSRTQFYSSSICLIKQVRFGILPGLTHHAINGGECRVEWVIPQWAIDGAGAIGIENDGDLVEVLRNIGSQEALIFHFSLSLRNPSLQGHLLVLASLTDFGKQRVSHLSEAQEHTLFLVSFAPD
jgi:hypothetical protein